jgi:hypothetical protein
MANIKTLAKEVLRWGMIAATGGYGAWELIEAGRRGIRMQWRGDWSDILGFVVFLIPVIFAAPFLAVAFLCLRRQYRKLYLVLGVIGTVVIFFFPYGLPEQLGIFQFMDRHIHENHDFAFLGLPLALLLFFGPIYAAAWFFRLCRRLTYPVPVGAKRPKTQATRWLVWLGVLCLVVPPTIDMLVTFNRITQSSYAPISQESIINSLRWIIGLWVIGSLLMFLGLVRRQPIPEAGEEPLPPETA